VIALLDPAMFVWGAPDSDLSRADEAKLEALLGLALQAARAANARITPVETYWNTMWRELVEPLRKRLQTSSARAAIDELRKRAGQPTTFPAAPPSTRVWGFLTMFGHIATMPAAWVDRMASAASQAIASGQPVMLLVRLVPSRNMAIHTGKQHVMIEEVTRWRLYVRLLGAASHTPIDCVRSPAQVRRPWTIRYDERLPTSADHARYAFCLPPDWHRGRITAVGTRASVPAWLDAVGRAWTRPNIPGGAGYHWDVFLEDPEDVAAVGTAQLNVVAYGAPPAEGIPGDLHHVPTDKQGRVRDVGWSCP
jgi:hypothetical protein